MPPSPEIVDMTSDYSAKYRAVPEELAQLRTDLRPFLSEVLHDADTEYDVLVACSEAVANAIEHPLDRTDPLIAVEAHCDGDELVISVRDSGHWRLARTAAELERGRGLVLMNGLTQLSIETHDHGTTVILRAPLSA
jgi:anti-sigma regulatory factor (Ser/Thr protein kinase)